MIRGVPAAALLLGVAACDESIALDPARVEVVDEIGELLDSAGPVRLRGAPECGADIVAIIEIGHAFGDRDFGERPTYVGDPGSVIPRDCWRPHMTTGARSTQTPDSPGTRRTAS